MAHDENLKVILDYLSKKNIYSFSTFDRELAKIVTTLNNKQKFYKDFNKNFTFSKKELFFIKGTSGKFEHIEELDNNNKLLRYEHRKCGKNLRILFSVDSSDNIKLLVAFVEDGDKKKGKNSYKSNIENAKRIFYNKEV